MLGVGEARREGSRAAGIHFSISVRRKSAIFSDAVAAPILMKPARSHFSFHHDLVPSEERS